MTVKQRLAKLDFSGAMARHPDRVSGALLTLVACIAIFEASHLPFGTIRAPDAGFFPLSLSTLFLVFAVGIFVNSFLAASEPAEFSSRSWYVVIAACAFIIYAVSVVKVGFVLATVIIMLVLMRGLGGMSWTRALLIAIPGVVVSYIGFIELGVPLPRGPLPF